MLTRTLGVAVLAAAVGLVPAAALGAPSAHLMVPHSAFFSLETHQDVLMDPQVFVAAPGAPASTGPRGIPIAAGERSALMTDDPQVPLLNAQGRALGVTAGTWFGGRGTIVFDPAEAHPRIAAAFAGLVPNGVYSLFEVTFGPSSNTFAPLDGTGRTNTFTANADGNGSIDVVAPAPLTHANGVVLVWHSDGTAHGTDRGQAGVTAHHQLIYRVP